MLFSGGEMVHCACVCVFAVSERDVPVIRGVVAAEVTVGLIICPVRNTDICTEDSPCS